MGQRLTNTTVAQDEDGRVEAPRYFSKPNT
jgi:hypothetical protein